MPLSQLNFSIQSKFYKKGDYVFRTKYKVILVLLFLFLLADTDAAHSSPKPNQVFQSLIPILSQQSQVPILLPANIPDSLSAEKAQIYADIETATPFEYTVVLGFDPRCITNTPCRLGFISGKVITPITLPLEEEYEYDPSYRTLRSPEPPGFVFLDGGQIKAYFLPYSCFTICSDSSLAWDYKGYRYAISIRSATKKDLVDMANSMFKS